MLDYRFIIRRIASGFKYPRLSLQSNTVRSLDSLLLSLYERILTTPAMILFSAVSKRAIFFMKLTHFCHPDRDNDRGSVKFLEILMSHNVTTTLLHIRARALNLSHRLPYPFYLQCSWLPRHQTSLLILLLWIKP